MFLTLSSFVFAATPSPAVAPLTLTAQAFAPGAAIPRAYTCEGGDAWPALTWSGAPATTKSLALIVDDPDAPDPAAPKVVWVHRVLYDVPADATGLPDAAPPAGAHDGTNDWGKTGWGGPCPPIGVHRYFFKLYALDVALGDRGAMTKAELEAAMVGHVVGQATLIGTYQKGG